MNAYNAVNETSPQSDVVFCGLFHDPLQLSDFLRVFGLQIAEPQETIVTLCHSYKTWDVKDRLLGLQKGFEEEMEGKQHIGEVPSPISKRLFGSSFAISPHP